MHLLHLMGCIHLARLHPVVLELQKKRGRQQMYSIAVQTQYMYCAFDHSPAAAGSRSPRAWRNLSRRISPPPPVRYAVYPWTPHIHIQGRPGTLFRGTQPTASKGWDARLRIVSFRLRNVSFYRSRPAATPRAPVHFTSQNGVRFSVSN